MMLSVGELTSLITVVLTIIGILLSAGWVSATWLNRKFAEVNHMIDEKVDSLEETIVKKLEYHEQHDDARFAEMRKTSESRFNEVKNDIWDIRVRNASKDGLSPLRLRDK